MKIKTRLSVIMISNLMVLLLLGFSLAWLWLRVDNALVVDNYAGGIDLQINRLSGNLREVVEQSSEDNFNHWYKAHQQLTDDLQKFPVLSPKQLVLLRSLQSHNQGLVALFSHISAEPSNSLQNDQQVSKAKIAKHLYGKMQAMREDSALLSKMAKQDIRNIVVNQFSLLGIVFAITVFLLIFVSRKLLNSISMSVKSLLVGFRHVMQGKLDKPVSIQGDDEFYELASVYNKMLSQLNETTITKNKLQEAVEQRTQELRELAELDPLTGIWNRRKLFDNGLYELVRCLRHSQNFSVLMIDLDFFKRINDQYGHDAGDEVLKHFAQLVQSVIREIDIFVRYGGEEFAILLPETSLKNAAEIAERLRLLVQQSSLEIKEDVIRYTVSIGISEAGMLSGIDGSSENGSDNKKILLEKLLKLADEAMYQSKQNGRNQVTIFKQH